MIAAPRWGSPAEAMTVPPARPGSVETRLHELLPERAVLVFGGRRPAGLGSPDRSTTGPSGWSTTRRFESWGNYVPTRLGERYDAFIWCDETTALHPLPALPAPARWRPTRPASEHVDQSGTPPYLRADRRHLPRRRGLRRRSWSGVAVEPWQKPAGATTIPEATAPPPRRRPATRAGDSATRPAGSAIRGAGPPTTGPTAPVRATPDGRPYGREVDIVEALTWKDGLATILTGTAVALYGAHLGGADLASGRAVAGAVLVLGLGACIAGSGKIFGDGTAKTTVLMIGVLGVLALTAGLIALITGGEVALGMLAGATVALWAIATVRHLLAGHVTDREIRKLIEREQEKGRRRG